MDRDALIAAAVDGYFGRVARRDLEGVLANFTAASVMDVPTLGIGYRGKAAIRAHFEDFLAAYPSVRFAEFRPTADAAGRSVAVRFVVTLTGHDGETISMRNCNFFDLDADGRFDRVTIYTTAAPDAGFGAGATRD